MGKIETTSKEFRAGISVTAKGSTVHWESTGHLSVQLLDPSGTTPLVRCKVEVDIPKEGSVSTESDEQGRIFHPDVPFVDYELDLGEHGKVTVPAVATRSEVHRCPVAKAKLGWVDLFIVDDDGLPVASGTVTIEGESHDLGDAAEPGRVRLAKPIVSGSGKTEITIGEQQVNVELPLLPMPTVVRLPKRGS